MKHNSSIWAIAKKEVYHIVRDPFTIALALAMPVVMVLVFGYAIEFNMNHIPLAIFDADHTESSRSLSKVFTTSSYFKPTIVLGPAQALKFIDSGRARAALIIPPKFEKDFRLGQESSVQILVDGADNSSAASIMSYLNGIQRLGLEKKFGKENVHEPVEIESRFLFNPELNSQWFVVPGLAAVIVAILSILLTALTVAREWENGSMELLLSTPVRPLEIIIGKLLPYCVMGFCAVIFVFIMSLYVFEIPFRGSLFLYLLCSLVFLLTYLAQGLLISVVTRKQQMSMQFAMLSGLLPTILLSGFVFPNEHMPPFFYYFTMILPARWFIQISRELYLQGAGVSEIWPEMSMLVILCLAMLFLANAKFKKDVEP